MQQLYLASRQLDAQRLRAFLARHEIGAEIRETAADTSESRVDPNPDSAQFCIWVPDDQVLAAGQLLSDYQAIVDQTSEYIPPQDISDGASRRNESPPARCRVPWLTFLLCLACLIPSIGLWREPRPESTSAAVRWGWRDSQDVNDGSYWAVLTSVFLHPTVEHLVMNLAGIAVLGWAIERACGRICWTSLTFTAILVSAAGELAVHCQLGVGASGILFSFFGFTLMASARKRLVPWWLLLLISIWLLLGVIFDMASAIDHQLSARPHDPWSTYAHLAGFGVGLVFALAFVICWKPWLTRTALACTIAAACVPLNGSPWLSDWLITRGYREYRQGNLQAAIAWYSRAISHRDQPAAAYVGRGEVLLFNAQLDEALADFAAALKLDAKIPNARALRAAVFVLRSDLDSAWNESNAGFQNGACTSYEYLMRGTIALARADYDAAAKDFETAIDREPGIALHWGNRAVVRVEQSRHDEALADANHALWLDPQDAAGLSVRGQVLHDLSHSDRARADMERAYQLVQRELILRPRDIWTLCQLANLQLALFEIDPSPQRLLEARLLAEQALQLAPAFWEAWRTRGTVDFYQKKYALAEQHLSRALELNSQDVWAACHLGLTLHELGRPDDALRSLDRAISLNPQFGYAYRSRGLVRNARNDYPTAILDLTRAVALNPRFAEAYHLRGKARLAEGDAEAGRKDLQRAAELNSKYAGEDQSGD